MIKRMFMLSKRSRSSKLLKACQIESVEHTEKKMKVKFRKRLMENKFTQKIVNMVYENDHKAMLDKKSIICQLRQGNQNWQN